MVRNWCQKKIDYYHSRGRDVPKYTTAYVETRPTNCLRQNCCDVDRLWCLKADCSIFECNKTYWGQRSNKISKKVEKLAEIGEKFINLMENAENEGVDFSNNYDIKTYEFYKKLFEIMEKWHPLENGMGEIELFYKERGLK